MMKMIARFLRVNWRLGGWVCVCLLVLIVGPAGAATPADNDKLVDGMSVLIGALDTGVVAGLIPDPVASRTGELIEYGTNLGLKGLAPAFNPPGDLSMNLLSGSCTVEFFLPQTTDGYEDWFGFWTLDPLATNWGELGQPSLLHVNSQVVVSVFGVPMKNDRAVFPEGVHTLSWTADTLVSPVFDILVPPILVAAGTLAEIKYGAAVSAKIAKKSPRVARVLKYNVVKFIIKAAKAAGIKGATRLIQNGLALGDELVSASNSATQTITVWDIHPPYIKTDDPSVTLEATDLGGTRLIRVYADLVNRLEYGDACSRIVHLTHDAPNILPMGTTTVTWRVEDDGPYRSGVPSFSEVQQIVTVRDTQPPILLAPEGFVREVATGQASINLNAIDLGLPRVIDLANPAPTVSNDAPSSFAVGVRSPVYWTASDGSGNTDRKVQWITAKRAGTNTAPMVANVQAATLTSERVEIRLDGIDLDVLPIGVGNQSVPMVDPLAFKIVDFPQNGEFVAPLRPFFIEDFRLTPIGETEVAGIRTSPLGNLAKEFAALPTSEHFTWLDTNFCQQDETIPEDMVYQPTYVHVTDEDIYYVRDNYWVCEHPVFGRLVQEERISKWSSQREFLGHYTLSDARAFGTPRDVFTVDSQNNIWWINDEPSFGGDQFSMLKVDENFGNLRSQTFAVSENDKIVLGRDLDHAHADPERGVFYVLDRRGVLVYGLDDGALLGRLRVNGEEFFFPGPSESASLQPDLRSFAYWMATDRDGALYISDAGRDRIHKFAASIIDENGSLVPGAYSGWMGRCSANEPPWNACDEKQQISRGYGCDDDKCLTEQGTAGDNPGQFDTPVHINLGPDDILYVADYNNLRVQRFGSDGTFAGEAKSSGSGVNQGEAPGFVLGNMGNPRAVSVNASHFFVMEWENIFGDYFLHSFETLPFWKIDVQQGHPNDVDGDGFEDNSVIVKYVSHFNFPGGLGRPNATDSFTYRASDGLASSNLGRVSIAVQRNFRPPEQLAIRCYPSPDLVDAVPCELDEDSQLFVQYIAKDPDGIVGFGGLDTLAYSPKPVKYGTMTPQASDAASATYLYQPDPDFYGQETLTFTVSDGQDLTVSDPFTLTVNPVNDDPVFSLAYASAIRGFPATMQIQIDDADADPTETLPAMQFNWGNGTVESPTDAASATAEGDQPSGPLLMALGPGKHQVLGMPVYTDIGDYPIEVAWQYDPDDSIHDDTPHRVELGSLKVIEIPNTTIIIELSTHAPLPSESIDMEIRVDNHAPEGWAGLEATGVVAEIDIPPGLLLHGTGSACRLEAADGRLHCTLGSLKPGFDKFITGRLTVDTKTLPKPVYRLRASVQTDGPNASTAAMAEASVFVQWPDGDGDGLPDAWEQAYRLNLEADDAHLDQDGDGLSHLEEYLLGTHPSKADTDGDGVPDGQEVTAGTDPLVPDAPEPPGPGPCLGDLDDDGDVDGKDLFEYVQGTSNVALETFAAEFGRTDCQ